MTVLDSAPWVDTKMNLQLLIHKLFNDYRLLTNNLYFGYYPLFAVISIIVKKFVLTISTESPPHFPLFIFIISQSYRIVNKTAGILIRRLYKEKRKEWGSPNHKGAYYWSE